MLNKSGNLIEENIPITKELLDFALANNYKISLKTGDYRIGDFKENPRKAFNMNLLTPLNELYLNGELYPKLYSECLNIPKHQGYLVTIFKKQGLLTLNRKESDAKYRTFIQETAKSTYLERHGVEHLMKSKDHLERRKQACLERHGVEHPSMLSSFKQNYKQTCLERYGVDNPMKVREFMEAQHESCIKHYGGVGNGSTELLKRFHETCYDKYGVTHPMKLQAFKNAVSETCYEKYGVTNFFKHPDFKSIRIETCRVKYGVDHHLQNPEILAKQRDTNMWKYGVEYPMRCNVVLSKSLKGRALNGIGNPVNYSGIDDDIISGKVKNRFAEARSWVLGLSGKSLFDLDYHYNSKLRYAKLLGLKEPTVFMTEIRLQTLLDSLGVDYAVNAMSQHQVRNPNGSLYELDIFIPSLNLGIEINGLQNHSVNAKAMGVGKRKSKEYHFEKFKAFHESGILMLSFTDYEQDHFTEDYISIIKLHLGLLDKEDFYVSEEFLAFNQISSIEESLNYGLFDANQFTGNFEDHQHQRFISKYEYWDCGKL